MSEQVQICSQLPLTAWLSSLFQCASLWLGLSCHLPSPEIFQTSQHYGVQSRYLQFRERRQFSIPLTEGLFSESSFLASGLTTLEEI